MKISGRTAVPAVYESAGVTAGSVYMCDAQRQPVLDAKQKAILETADDQRLELVTRHEIGIAVNVGGTYLNPTDYAKLAQHTNATLRPYSWRDTLGKVLSGAGIVTLLLTATALATPVAALVLLHFQQPGQNVAAVADLAQTVLQWVRQPVDALDVAQLPTSLQVSAARVEVNRRSEEASRCFRTVQGHQAPTASIPGVSCSAPQTQWWQDPAAAPLVATVLGLITAALGLAKLRTSFGFQKSPTL